MMWEILQYGQKPYKGLSTLDAAHAIRDGTLLDCPANCPSGLYDLMKSCWDMNPLNRPDFLTVLNQLRVIKKSVPKSMILGFFFIFFSSFFLFFLDF